MMKDRGDWFVFMHIFMYVCGCVCVVVCVIVGVIVLARSMHDMCICLAHTCVYIHASALYTRARVGIIRHTSAGRLALIGSEEEEPDECWLPPAFPTFISSMSSSVPVEKPS